MRRLDFAGTYGWQGTINRGDQVKTKFFADRKYGSKSNSRIAAQEWEENIRSAHPHAKRKFIPRSNTNVVGISVHRRICMKKKKRCFYKILVANIWCNKKHRIVSRSLRKYSYVSAMRELRKIRDEFHKPQY